VSNGSDGSHGIRGKLEGAVDKLKNQDGSDDDDDEGGRLSRLLPKGIGSMRRRKKEEKEAEIRAGEEAARGRSVAERGTLENDNGDYATTTDGDGSSLITYESENEEYDFVYFLHLLVALHLLRSINASDCVKICFARRFRSEIPRTDHSHRLSLRTIF
jgi:hypothetical protein